jgi:MoaA/NifB/PqqE/SkfB family radical SAM enzyme
MKRKQTLASLKKKLDKIFGQYIRTRDTDLDGFGACISCGRPRKLQAGHFIKRQHLQVRWNEKNCHGQCVYCNKWLGGNELEYEQVLIKKYGQNEVNKLLAGKRGNPHFRQHDYLAMIEEYKVKLARIR